MPSEIPAIYRFGGREYDERKLAELMLHVAQKSADDPRFGAIKLNKILFYADFWSYASRGVSITGAEYQRLRFGPAPRRLLPARDRLTKDGAASIQEFKVLEHTWQRLVALRDPNYSILDAADIAIVDQVIEKLWERDGADLGAATHRIDGWKLAEQGDTVPYFSVFLPASPLPLTQEEIEYGKKVASRLTIQNRQRAPHHESRCPDQEQV